MNALTTLLMFVSVVTLGLSAGLFTSWSYAVMPGLHRSSDRSFVEVMQHTIRAMRNGWSAVVFGGALLFPVLACVLLPWAEGPQTSQSLPWLVIALVLYVAVLVITFAIHVPLNKELGAAGAVDRIADLAAVRERFEDRWVRWNVVRSVLGTLAFACAAWGLLQYGHSTP
ncbi:DUF1772 domain-containing protein [Streptomyces sp. NPDC052309]|uniref:anthrone oxygenase family protein n=1 Tax=Streptomyces sp. NPDC052309 TaxID=3155421 RepID=UPI003429BD06